MKRDNVEAFSRIIDKVDFLEIFSIDGVRYTILTFIISLEKQNFFDLIMRLLRSGIVDSEIFKSPINRDVLTLLFKKSTIRFDDFIIRYFDIAFVNDNGNNLIIEVILTPSSQRISNIKKLVSIFGKDILYLKREDGKDSFDVVKSSPNFELVNLINSYQRK